MDDIGVSPWSVYVIDDAGSTSLFNGEPCALLNIMYRKYVFFVAETPAMIRWWGGGSTKVFFFCRIKFRTKIFSFRTCGERFFE